MRSRRLAAAVCALAVTLVVGTVQATTASAAPYCGITWGSLAKSSPEMVPGPITGARVGRHDCWDRLVIDLGTQPAAGFNVQYTNGFWAEGSGNPLSVSGGAILRVVVRAPAYDLYGNKTVPWTVGSHIVTPSQFSAGGFRTFRDLVYGGSFEGQTALGLGVRARLPFRVLKLAGPGEGSRLVIDVAHLW